MPLFVLRFPAASSAATVNVCVPGVLVSIRPPLWIAAPPSVEAVQLVIAIRALKEHSNCEITCWLSA